LEDVALSTFGVDLSTFGTDLLTFGADLSTFGDDVLSSVVLVVFSGDPTTQIPWHHPIVIYNVVPLEYRYMHE